MVFGLFGIFLCWVSYLWSGMGKWGDGVNLWVTFPRAFGTTDQERGNIHQTPNKVQDAITLNPSTLPGPPFFALFAAFFCSREIRLQGPSCTRPVMSREIRERLCLHATRKQSPVKINPTFDYRFFSVKCLVFYEIC